MHFIYLFCPCSCYGESEIRFRLRTELGFIVHHVLNSFVIALPADLLFKENIMVVFEILEKFGPKQTHKVGWAYLRLDEVFAGNNLCEDPRGEIKADDDP